jgi:hypothetical protein
VSALVGILAVLAFGTLYGLLGVFIAIPMTAAIQVLLESMVVDATPTAAEDPAQNPWAGLRARIRALRQQVRVRLRARESRMGIDPATADHVADAVDQQIEQAGAQVERTISAAEETSEPLAAKERAAIVGKLEARRKTSSRPRRGWKRSSQQTRTRRHRSTTWSGPRGTSRTLCRMHPRAAAVAHISRREQAGRRVSQSITAAGSGVAV